MPGRDEIVRSIRGAWMLFLGRAEGMRLFDLGIDGFWRSFGALFLILPFFAVVALSEQALLAMDAESAGMPPPDGTLLWLSRTTSLLVGWLALPLILGSLARPLGIARTYVPFIIARNWSAVIAAIPVTVGAVLSYGVGAEIGGIVTLAALFIVLRYNFMVARIALEASLGLAAAVTILDFLLGIVLNTGIDRLYGL